jgi:hypothetical protein
VEYESVDFTLCASRGEDVGAACGSCVCLQRGLRGPQVGAGVGACVVCVGVGLAVLVGLGEGIGFFDGGAVVATGFGLVVGVVRVGTLPVVGCAAVVAADVRVTVGATDGTSLGFADGEAERGAVVGLSLTLTLRLSRPCVPPNVDGITESGSAWKPMTASRPVATVASSTMTMLGSSGPRCDFPLIVATSPRRLVMLGFYRQVLQLTVLA